VAKLTGEPDDKLCSAIKSLVSSFRLILADRLLNLQNREKTQQPAEIIKLSHEEGFPWAICFSSFPFFRMQSCLLPPPIQLYKIPD